MILDTLAMFVLRPAALVVWIIASIWLYRLARSLNGVLLLLAAIPAAICDALLQCTLGGLVQLDDRLVGTLIALHETLWLICGILVILICQTAARRPASHRTGTI